MELHMMKKLPNLKNCNGISVGAVKVGHVENTDIDDVVRIVHISDTHMAHDTFLSSIPDGDILIHSGDFFNYKRLYTEEDFDDTIGKINAFFSKLPHKYKILVAGNHDVPLQIAHSMKKDICSLMPHGIYLCDTLITIKGITIYGTPWNNAEEMAFYQDDLKPVWDKIPRNVDILVTHIPPFGIKDFGYNKFWDFSGHKRWVCDLCTEKNQGEAVYHGESAHQGCRDLKHIIFTRIRPKAHLFGHVHNHNGPCWQDGILFSNGAMMCDPRPIVIDFHKAKKSSRKFLNCLGGHT